VNTGAAIGQGRYIALDAADVRSAIMHNDVPDPVPFAKLLGGLIVTASEAKGGARTRVAIFGELVHLLWAQHNAEAAIQIEKLGNELTKIYDIDVLCGYSLGGVPGGMEAHLYQQISAQHSAIYSR
jgi:hypothetical protein